MGSDRTDAIAGRYRLREQLGRGGMGIVWRARDERLERDVAVKILHPWVADDPELRQRFEREASALARLEHPNVVRLYDVVEDHGRTALVMELVEGVSLAALVAGRTLGWDEARALAAPIAAGLTHAHARGVVHRDLTPANVLVERGTGRIVVTDFGLARLARASASLPVSGVLAGTPEYWAPEQAAGHETGPQTDLYALGVILFRLLAGRVPFEGEDRLAAGLRRAHEDAPRLRDVAPSLPPTACELVDRLLARTPARRPDALAAAQALGADPSLLPGRETIAFRARPAAEQLPVTLERPTRLWPGEDDLPTVLGPAAAPTTLVVRSSPRSGHRSRRRGRAALLVAGAATVLALGGGVYAVASDPPTGIDAPDVVGGGVDAARDDVTQRAERDRVPIPKVKVVDRSYSESLPAGRVIAQDPAPGERIGPGGALLVSVSKGSAYAEVPSVAGLETRAAAATLERAGFVPTRRFAPSTEIAAWHAVDTDPAPGTRVKRPATVTVVVSTGPPQVPVPRVAGLNAGEAAAALREAGFVPVVAERPSDRAAGSLLRLDPAAGTRAPVGSTVTIVIARDPVWTTVSLLTGDGSSTTGAITVPAGARLRIETDNRSFLDLRSAELTVVWTGDADGSVELTGGEEAVLLDPASHDRTIEVTLTADGDVRWWLEVEEPR